MYTYFSRLLHHTLSYSGLTQISRLNKFANWFDLDHRVKPDGDGLCAGRSMVEMLGVLAIIGVLSVGAISGYSKAMFKYKLNKHTEQMNTLINTVARNVRSFDNLKAGSILTPYFIKMGEIPTEMVKSNDNNFVYDIFGHKWVIIIDSDAYIYLMAYSEDGSSFLSSNSPDSLAICQNILTIAKENHNNIYSVIAATNGSEFYIYGDDADDELDDAYGWLQVLTLDNIHTICAKHSKGGESLFAITWKRW